ncbi:MAG: DUF58 domain-containing protein [Flammeovirgaceae bacterium]
MEINFNKIKEYGNIELLARQLVEGFITGLHKSPYHGFSVEFAEHNLYNAGESTRHIDWKVFARTDRLYTKRYEEETNLRCMIVVDNSSSMYYPVETKSKIGFSLLGAASLAYMLQKQRDAFGLCTFSENIENMTPVKSTEKHLNLILTLLQNMFANVPQQRQSNVAGAIHEVAERIHKRSLVVIFSDMMDKTEKLDEIFSALQHLKHNQHEVLLFHVFDKKTELSFDFPERPFVFVDLETGQEEKLRPSLVRKAYQAQIQEIYQEIKVRCGYYKIDFIEADVAGNIDQILLSYLIKRKKMG